MTKNKHNSTKMALLVSVLSMVLCIAMLVGSTFAWFTDTATAGINSIQAGKLNVVLQKQVIAIGEGGTESETWQEVGADETLGWVTADGRDQEKVLWEPGCTYTLPTLKIVNKGNLALKYKVMISGVAGDNPLLKAIEFTVLENGATEAKPLADWGGVLLPSGAAATTDPNEVVGETKSFTISAHMKEDATNECQGKKLEGVGITVVATQYTYESDSNNNQYDEGALFPVASQSGFAEALDQAAAGDEILLAAGEYSLPTAQYAIAEGVTLTGEAGAKLVVDGNKSNTDGNTTSNSALKITTDNVTISNIELVGQNVGSNEYDAFVRIEGNNVTLDNVTINSRTNAAPIVIGNTSGADNVITIKDCNITAAFKAIHIVDGTVGTVKIDGCTIDAVYPFNVNTTSVLNMIVTNSTLNGWTSYGNTVTKVVFDNCNFGVSHSYGYVVAYADTDFINCTFSSGFLAETKDGFPKTMTFTNCNKNGTKITAENVKDQFHADNDSDCIDQAKGWTVIVDGTTVETLK